MKLPIKVKPYEHQVKAFNFAEEKLTDYSGIALLMDMGLGKSLTSIAIIGDKYLKPGFTYSHENRFVLSINKIFFHI